MLPSPLETPLLPGHSSLRSPAALPSVETPALFPIGSLALPLLSSSAPSCPAPSEGCNIRFTIWGLSCYNNRRRLCCEEQLAPGAARLPRCLRPCSLVGSPPRSPPPQPGLFPVWCVRVCVHMCAQVCPARECDVGLSFHGCACELGVRASRCACVCMCVCADTHAVFAAFPLRRASPRDCVWEKGHIGSGAFWGAVLRWCVPTTLGSLNLGTLAGRPPCGWGEGQGGAAAAR